MLLYFEDEVGGIGTFYLESRVDGGNHVTLAFEGNVDHRANHLCYLAYIVAHMKFI